MTEYEERQQAKRERIAGLIALNPHLLPVTPESGGATHASKNIRIELKRAFPGVKFSVKTDHFAGGNSIRIRWDDGPNTKAASEVIGRFCYGRFDGMTDSYVHSDDVWSDAFGGCKYMDLTRNVTQALVQKAVDALEAEYGKAPLNAAALYLTGGLSDVSPIGNWDKHWYWSWREIIRRKLEEM